MKIPSPYAVITCATILSLLCSTASAQVREQPAGPAATSEMAAVGNGWSALAAGRVDDALKIADAILTRRPRDHRAVDLKIEALAGAHPIRALDAYEAWLGGARLEDVFLLAPIARGALEQIAAGPDEPLRKLALTRLADSGDTRAAARMQELSKQGSGTDVQRAIDGDAAAATRLLESKTAQQLPPHTLARILPAAGPGAAPVLRSLLKHPAAPVRMEAALALGRAGAVDAIPELKAMMADPEVRSYAAVALTRLGDPDGEAVTQELLQSPIMDMRVLAAQAYAGKPGPWVQALMPALQDPNGLTRIRAAELVAPVAPEAARAVLLEAAKDPNPVVRADVTRVLERTEVLSSTEQSADPIPGSTAEARQGLATLRRMLRDPDPMTRIHAATSILTYAKGAR